MISQGASKINVAFVVADRDAEAAGAPSTANSSTTGRNEPRPDVLIIHGYDPEAIVRGAVAPRGLPGDGAADAHEPAPTLSRACSAPSGS
jgi:hypothetical protein